MNFLKISILIYLTFILNSLFYSLPEIEITPESFDFGLIESGQTMKGEFIIKNRGYGLLNVKIKSSCDCMILKKKEVSIPSNKYETINYEIKTLKRDSGRFTKDIILESNDKSKKIFFIIIKGLAVNYDKETVDMLQKYMKYPDKFDKKTLDNNNILTIFNHKSDLQFTPAVNNMIYYAHKENNNIMINYYDLDDKRNNDFFLNICRQNKLPDNRPLAVYKKSYLCGEKEIFSCINGEMQINIRPVKTKNFLFF